MSSLKPYHHVWLSAHPDRDEAWLRRQLSDGFDIHHVDGNPGNNDPNNLVLIEHCDHFMIHSGKRPRIRSRPLPSARKEMRMSDGSVISMPLYARKRDLRILYDINRLPPRHFVFRDGQGELPWL